MSRRIGSVLLAGTLVVAACDSDPFGPIISPTITLTVNSMNASDVEVGVIDKDENISTGTGNPWGEFIAEARETCGGDPAGFDVTYVALGLDTDGSRGLGGLEDLFSGSASVVFRSTRGSDASATQVEVGSGSVTGTGPSALAIATDRSGLLPLHERLVGGDFHVAVRGATDRTSADDFSADVRVTLAATAYCR